MKNNIIRLWYSGIKYGIILMVLCVLYVDGV